MLELDLRHRRIVFAGGEQAGGETVLICKPLSRQAYQRWMVWGAKLEQEPETGFEAGIEILRDHIVRVEGLKIRPEEGDPHEATKEELLNYGPLLPRLMKALSALMRESVLPEIDTKKSGAPLRAGLTEPRVRTPPIL